MAVAVNVPIPIADDIYHYTSKLEGVPIVIDNGSYNCRAGFASQNDPYLIFKNVVSKPRLKKDNILVGNDIPDLEALRNTIKIAFDRNLVTNLEIQEYVFDHVFYKLGITSSSVNHPIVLNESVNNPNICRSQMSELLFEGYGVPSVAYFIDSVASYYNSQCTTSNKTSVGELKDGLIVSLGYHTVHLLPVLNGRMDSTHAKRVNIGGAYTDWYMQRLLQLKYPPHMNRVTLGLAENLIHTHCRVTPNYRQELIKLKQPEELKKATTVVQLPYLKAEDSASNEQMQQKRQLQIQRLKEAHKKRHQERLNRDEEHLKNLTSIDDLVTMGYNDYCKPKNKLEVKAAIRKALKAAGLKSIQDLKETLTHYKGSVKRLQCQIKGVEYKQEEEEQALKTAVPIPTTYNMIDIADEDLDAEELKLKRRQQMMKGAAERREKMRALKEAQRKKMVEAVKQLEEKRSDDFLGWLTSLRFKRQALIESRIQRKNRKPGVSTGGLGGVSTGGGGVGASGGGVGGGSATEGDRKWLQQHRIRLMAAELQSGGGSSSRRGQQSSGSQADPSSGGNSSLMGGAGGGGGQSVSQVALADLEFAEHDSEDSEAEQEQLTQLDTLLAQYDPDFSKDLGGAGLKVDFADFYQLHLSTEKTRVPEVYFHPELVGCDQAGVMETLSWLLASYPPPQQQLLASNIVLTGAAAALPGLRDRVQAEVTSLRPYQTFSAVTVAPSCGVGAWHGARRMTQLPNFPQLCVTKADYDEMGHDYIKEHFLGNLYFPYPSQTNVAPPSN